MKCIRCNKFMFDSVKLADGRLCMKCFRDLGFDKSMKFAFDTVPFDQIKDGADSYFEYCRERDNTPEEDEAFFGFADYGQERELNATDEEKQIYNYLLEVIKENGYETDLVRFVRRSSNYVSASIDGIDLARFKFTKRAKWILFPSTGYEKVALESPEDVKDLTIMILDGYSRAMFYSGHFDQDEYDQIEHLE